MRGAMGHALAGRAARRNFAVGLGFMAAIGLLRSGHAPDHDAQNATPTAGARFQITLELGIRQRKKGLGRRT
ncbi:hypothetical protein [Methyloceanibacter sp.]|uniref:hypothetical protein n=1 Tax=Methyloceanibacter sp. TaxID=1965321 RepID=UPI002C1897B1|nr:hypothetical protein [Methyloceanibacter sp.]HML91008.1 hypothetical protein [Methyloceanibacter sp.]